jgi:DNA-binding CsgD family transcriptional regulator
MTDPKALTNRHIHMILMRGAGHTNQQIGELYGINTDTVRDTIRRTVNTLGAQDAVHALAVLLVSDPAFLGALGAELAIPEQAHQALRNLTGQPRTVHGETRPDPAHPRGPPAVVRHPHHGGSRTTREPVMRNTQTACPGRENNTWRKAEKELAEHGTPHDITPRLGNPLHCHACTNRAHRQLGELPELVAAIHLEALHASRSPKVGTIGRIGGGTAPWPGQAARLLADRIIGGMLDLEDDIRDLRNLTTRPGRGNEGASLTAARAFIDAHLDWALTNHPAATEPHDRDSANPAAQIDSWHRAAQRFTARAERAEHHRTPCPRCDLLTLYRANGDDYIECRNPACGTLLTSSEYLDHTREMAHAYRSQRVA